MKKMKVGVFGFGDVAPEYVKAINGNGHAEVVAIVGRDQEKTRARAHALGFEAEILSRYEELVERKDIDIIINTGPHYLHAKETIMAAKAGKHIVCEKPMGMNREEVKQVYDAVKKANVHFQCGMVLRWNPYILTLKRLIDNGTFGDLFFIEFDYFHKLDRSWNGFSWGGQNKSGGPSASLVAGIHAVDLMRHLGGEIKQVFAAGTYGHRKDFGYPPTYTATVAYKNGAVGKTGCSFEGESPYLFNTLIHGSKGSVVYDSFYFKGLFPGQTGWQKFTTIMPDSGAVSHHPFKFLIDDFIDAILHDRPSVNNIDETYRTHELCMAIDHSIETNEKVELPFF